MTPTPSRGPSADAKRKGQPFRSRTLGTLLVVVSPVLAVVLFLMLLSLQLEDFRFTLYGFAFLVVGVYYGVLTGRRLRAPDAASLMKRDPRPPLVFLRPFNEDRRVVTPGPLGTRQGGVAPGENKGRKTAIEVTLACLLHDFGPFIAVGRPGEALVTLGAARAYVSDDEWKEAVWGMIQRAGAVILQPEASAGTLWEAEQVARIVDRKRLLLIVPDPTVRPLRYARIRDVVQEQLGVTLPITEDCPPCDAFYFDGSGNPEPLRLELPRFRLSLPAVVGRWVGFSREDYAATVAEMPMSILASSPDLVRAAKPFVDRLAVSSNLGGGGQ
jgi:hypothetical protein